MGLFDYFKAKKEEKQNHVYVKMVNGEIPIYSQFGEDIYASDVVQQALSTIVNEMMKLNPKHIRKQGFDVIPVDDRVQRVLDDPNPLMTTGEFISKVMWSLLLNYNSFIYIQRDNAGNLTGLYPLRPTNVTFLEDPSGRLFLEMMFRQGDKHVLPYDNIIHLKYNYSVNDLMGGDENGQPNNSALLSTLKLNDILLQGVKKALNASMAVNGIVKYNTMLDDGSMKTNIEAFEKQLHNSQSGILGIDNKAEYIPVSRDIKIVDEPTLRFIDDKILRNYGTPLNIVRGDYTPEEYEAFYQKTLETFIIILSQGFTKKIFTRRASEGFNNKIVFYPKELVFMNTSQTLQMVHELGQTGTLFENEKRVAFGYEPLPELVGKRLQSLNYVDVNYVREYQTGNNTNTGIGKEGEEDE